MAHLRRQRGFVSHQLNRIAGYRCPGPTDEWAFQEACFVLADFQA